MAITFWQKEERPTPNVANINDRGFKGQVGQWRASCDPSLLLSLMVVQCDRSNSSTNEEEFLEGGDCGLQVTHGSSGRPSGQTFCGNEVHSFEIWGSYDVGM